MKFKKNILIIIHVLLLFISCKNNPWDIQVEKTEVQFETVNFDSLIINSKLSDIDSIHSHFTEQFGDAYLYEVSMNIQAPIDSSTPYMLKKFYENEYIAELESEKKELRPAINEQMEMLDRAFDYLLHHFPQVKTPKKIVFMNNLFSGIKVDEETLFIGLEKYLDSTSQVVKNIPNDQLHKWQKEAMNIDFLARDIVMIWIQNELFSEKDEHLAYHLIQAGKVLTVLQASFPKEGEAFILRYKEEDYSWAKENEQLFWEFIVKEEMLFKNNPRDKTNFLNEGPYTIGLPEKGPDRLGQFLGFQMVKSYLNSNKDLSLQELIEVEYNSILQAYDL